MMITLALIVLTALGNWCLISLIGTIGKCFECNNLVVNHCYKWFTMGLNHPFLTLWGMMLYGLSELLLLEAYLQGQWDVRLLIIYPIIKMVLSLIGELAIVMIEDI